MIKTRISTRNRVEPAEKFFVEKSLELLSNKTIDTYRIRLHNPTSILQELVHVIDAVNKNLLKSQYSNILCEEAKRFLLLENELVFSTIEKTFFIGCLAKKDMSQVLYCCQIIIQQNKDYSKNLFNRIKDELSRLNQQPIIHAQEYDVLNRLIPYFYTSLLKFGYNKQYLYKFVSAIFGAQPGGPDFNTQFDIIQTLIGRTKERFYVYVGFKFQGDGGNLFRLNTFNMSEISRTDIITLAASINYKFITYLQEHPNSTFFLIEEDETDYYTAAQQARKKIQKALDILYHGTEEDVFNLDQQCFVYGTMEPNKGKAQSLNHSLDGHFSVDQGSYGTFLQKINQLPFVQMDDTTVQKFYSTLRYLRLGSQANEKEHKLLNYWIAMEYLFTAPDGSGSKVDRLKEYFKKIHAKSYIWRLFVDLHHSLKKFRIQGSISLYSETNIGYLLDPMTETEIDSYKDRYPLLYYRFHALKKRYADTRAIKADIERHVSNLDWNIWRIYRTRNEIVHSAATDLDILDLAGHLKYYLIYTIHAFVEFLITTPVDLTRDNKYSIEDFFIMEALIHDSIFSSNTLNVQDLLALINPVEYLQT